jgi:hypothetical protein
MSGKISPVVDFQVRVPSKNSHPRFERHEKIKSEELVQGILATGHYPETTEYNPEFHTLFL